MFDLDKRAEFWQKHYTRLGAPAPTPFLDENIESFRDKRVLEIGPGEGRQFLRVQPITKSYAVADISEPILQFPIYQDVEKMKMKNHKLDFKSKFDIIHFWYLIHHVMIAELPEFFRMLYDNLKCNGTVFFNYPRIEKYKNSDLGNDGTKTSPITTKDIEMCSNPYFIISEHLEDTEMSFMVTMKRKK
jgi:SAM-dependent methyltransferase